MNTRKKIALITASPDEIYQQEIMKGVFSRCSEYGYDVAVITPLITLSHFYDIYLRGEINIYNLFNPDLFDGIIITSLAFAHQKNHFVFENIIRKLREKNYTNIVLLDQKIDGFKSSFTDDRPAVKEIAAHIYDYHGCSDVYFLSGPENGDSSERLEGYREFLRERGLECDESRIFYGDFWYTSGEKLAEEKINAIEKCISEKSSSSGKPFSISASLGYSVSVLDESLNLDELISIADAGMYENKKRKKAERKD